MPEEGLGQLAVGLVGDIKNLIEALKVGRTKIQNFSKDAIADLEKVESKLGTLGTRLSSAGSGQGGGKKGGGSASGEIQEKERLLELDKKILTEQGRIVEAQEKAGEKAASIVTRLKRGQEEISKTAELATEKIKTARSKLQEFMSSAAHENKTDAQRFQNELSTYTTKAKNLRQQGREVEAREAERDRSIAFAKSRDFNEKQMNMLKEFHAERIRLAQEGKTKATALESQTSSERALTNRAKAAKALGDQLQSINLLERRNIEIAQRKGGKEDEISSIRERARAEREAARGAFFEQVRKREEQEGRGRERLNELNRKSQERANKEASKEDARRFKERDQNEREAARRSRDNSIRTLQMQADTLRSRKDLIGAAQIEGTRRIAEAQKQDFTPQQMTTVHERNAEAIRKARIEQDKLTNSTEETGQAVNRLTGMIQRMIGAFIIYKMIDGFRALITAGINFNAIMEGTQAGIAGLLISVKDYVHITTGKAAETTLAFGAALKEAGKSMWMLQKINLETAATLPEILTQYQQLIATVGGLSGATPENLTALTKRFSILGQMFMIPQQQMAEEIRSATTGAMKPGLTRVLPFFVGQFLKTKQISSPEEANAVIKRWRAEGVEVKKLLELLAPMDAIAKKLQNTWAVALSNLKDLTEMLLGQGFKPLFEFIRDNVNTITNALKDPKEGKELLRSLKGINDSIIDILKNAKLVGSGIFAVLNFGWIGEATTRFIGLAAQVVGVGLVIKGLILLFHLLKNTFRLFAAESFGFFIKFTGLWVSMGIVVMLEIIQHWEWITERIKEAYNWAKRFIGLKVEEGPDRKIPERISKAFENTRAQTAKRITDLEEKRDKLLEKAPDEKTQSEIQARFEKEIAQAKEQQLKTDTQLYQNEIKTLETEKKITEEFYNQKITRTSPGKERTQLEQEKQQRSTEFDKRIKAAKEELEFLGIISKLNEQGKDLETEKEIAEWRIKRLRLHKQEIEALEQEKKIQLDLITNEKVKAEAAIYYDSLINQTRLKNKQEFEEKEQEIEEIRRKTLRPEDELTEIEQHVIKIQRIRQKARRDIEFEEAFGNKKQADQIRREADAQEEFERAETIRRIMKRRIEEARSEMDIAREVAETKVALGEWATSARITQIDQEIAKIRETLFFPLAPGQFGPPLPRFTQGVTRTQLREGEERIATLTRQRATTQPEIRRETFDQLQTIFDTQQAELQELISLGEEQRDKMVVLLNDQINKWKELRGEINLTTKEQLDLNKRIADTEKQRGKEEKAVTREDIDLEKQKSQFMLERSKFELSQGLISRGTLLKRIEDQIASLEQAKLKTEDPKKILQAEQEILSLQQEYASNTVNIWANAQQAISDGFMSILFGAQSFGETLTNFFKSLAQSIVRIFVEDMAREIVKTIRETIEQATKGTETEKKEGAQGLLSSLSDLLGKKEGEGAQGSAQQGMGTRLWNWITGVFRGGSQQPQQQGPPLPGAPGGLPGGAQGPTNPNAPGGPPPTTTGGGSNIGYLAALANVVSSAASGNTGQAIGSTIGAIAGSYFGPVGSMAGSQIGGMLGGLFDKKKKKDPIRAAIRDWWISTAKPALDELRAHGFGQGIFEGMTGSAFVKSLGWGKGIPQGAIESMKQALESLKDTLSDALERGFKAGTARSGFQVFLRSIRRGIAEYVTEGLIDGILKGKALTELFAPVFETVSTAVTKAIQFTKTGGKKGTAFDPQAFQQQIMAQWATVSPVLNTLQPLFTSLFGVARDFRRTIGQRGTGLWEGLPPDVLANLLGDIKQAHTGGVVTQSGLVNVQKGETISPPDSQIGPLNIQVISPNSQTRSSNSQERNPISLRQNNLFGLENLKTKFDTFLWEFSKILREQGNLTQGPSPQFLSSIMANIKQAHTGGIVTQSGLINVQKGEEISSSGKRGINVNAPVTVYANVSSPMGAVNTGTGIAWGLKQQLRGSF